MIDTKEVIKEVVKNHTKILDTDKQVEEVYNLGEDVVITVRQKREYVNMFAYDKTKNTNVSIYGNYRSLYNNFNKVADRIEKDKDNALNIYLKHKEDDVVEEGLGVDIIMLLEENKALKLDIVKLKAKIEELEKKLSSKNQRGAGRKSKLTKEQVLEIQALKGKKSIRKIAEDYNCSPALVHKLINE